LGTLIEMNRCGKYISFLGLRELEASNPMLYKLVYYDLMTGLVGEKLYQLPIHQHGSAEVDSIKNVRHDQHTVRNEMCVEY